MHRKLGGYQIDRNYFLRSEVRPGQYIKDVFTSVYSSRQVSSFEIVCILLEKIIYS